MQSVSASLIAEQAQPDGLAYYRIVELSRLYWNGSTMAWDTPVDISAYVAKVSTAKWKLDTRGFGEWKSPSFQVDLKDERNFWSELTSSGAWRTGLSGAQTYYPELSRIRVRIGHHLPDGTDEDVYAFGGLISKPLSFHDEKRIATAYCVGMDELLRRKSAEALSTAVTNELLGSDSGTEFETAQLGVGIPEMVVKRGTTAGGAAAATTLTPQTDYTIGQLNEKTLGAKVTLTSGLTAGNSLWISYRYWYQDKDLSWIVTQLLILAGITNYQVDPTIFANAIENTWVRTTTAHFDAGTLTNIDTSSTADSFRRKWTSLDEFTDNDFTNNPVWTPAGSGSSSGWSCAGGVLSAATPTNFMSTAYVDTNGVGSWDFKTYPSSGVSRVWFLGIAGGFFAPPATNSLPFGFHVEVNATITKVVYRPSSGSETIICQASHTPASGHKYRVTRNSSGDIALYIDTGGGFAQVATGNFSSVFSDQAVVLEATGNATFDEIRYTHAIATTEASSTATPVNESPILDAGASLTAYGLLTYVVNLNGGSVLVETYSSGDAAFGSDLDPAGWVAVSVSGQINSAVKRYLKVRFTLTYAAAGDLDVSSPVVDEYTVRYYTSSTTIPLVNMTGLSCYNAIVECAKYPCYEVGMTSTEKFFYRARTSSPTPVLRISHTTNMRKEISFNTGTDQVTPVVKASFGDYRVMVDCDSLSETQPNPKKLYGEREISLSSTLLPKEGANIAASAAATVHDYTHLPKKRSTVEMKMLVQYELGDPVVYEREHKHGRWVWGDHDTRYGDVDAYDFEWHADPSENGWDLNMRIEGVELDTEGEQMRLRYDLVEII